MSDPVFQQAFATVRGSWSDDAWSSLTPRQITEAIYLEIRRIDAVRRVKRPSPRFPPPPRASSPQSIRIDHETNAARASLRMK